MLAYAMVDAFVMPAKDNQIFVHRHAVGHFLIKLFSIGRSVNYFVVVSFTFQFCNNTVDRFNLQYHSGTETKGIIVHAAMFVGAVFAQVMHIKFYETFVAGTFHNRVVQWTIE